MTTELTPKQRAVAMMHAGGFPRWMAALSLDISVHTYNETLKIVRAKLGIGGDRVTLEKALRERYAQPQT